VNGYEFDTSGSSNPGPTYQKHRYRRDLREQPIRPIVRSLWGTLYYSSPTGYYAQYSLDDRSGDVTLTLQDYRAPWVVTPVPEASTWAG
jgi:hypothetical protein